jgi:hypothetical protein
MPRKSSTRIPSYRLHRPTGQAVVTLGGKDFYLGAYTGVNPDGVVEAWLATIPEPGMIGLLAVGAVPRLARERQPGRKRSPPTTRRRYGKRDPASREGPENASRTAGASRVQS